MARPTDCTPETLEKCREYVEGAWMNNGSVVPSIVGMALYCGVSKSTIHKWRRDDQSEQFSHYYEQCQGKQEESLINGGLNGDFTPAISKMLLAGHGHSDKIEQAHTSPDGSMTPTIITREIIDSAQD